MAEQCLFYTDHKEGRTVSEKLEAADKVRQSKGEFCITYEQRSAHVAGLCGAGCIYKQAERQPNPGQTPEKTFNSPPPICPHKSPDLNPVEHLWDVVEREICIRDVQSRNLPQLCDEACQLGKITSVNLDSVVRNMRNLSSNLDFSDNYLLQTQRRVTFHLPDGSQESCSDSGLGDAEPSSTASATQPLPLSFPQEEYYEQASPNSRTEGDGNSDPESTIEVNLKKALAEASETCTQECLILGHSDSCWMPPTLAQFQSPGSNSPTSTPTTTTITAALPSFGFQGVKANIGGMGVMDGRHTLGRSVPKRDELDKGFNRPQFYNTLDRHCSSKKEDPVKVIPLASFSSPGQHTPTGGSSSFLHEHQL